MLLAWQHMRGIVYNPRSMRAEHMKACPRPHGYTAHTRSPPSPLTRFGNSSSRYDSCYSTSGLCAKAERLSRARVSDPHPRAAAAGQENLDPKGTAAKLDAADLKVLEGFPPDR